jgi:hypothetical protein
VSRTWSIERLERAVERERVALLRRGLVPRIGQRPRASCRIRSARMNHPRIRCVDLYWTTSVHSGHKSRAMGRNLASAADRDTSPTAHVPKPFRTPLRDSLHATGHCGAEPVAEAARSCFRVWLRRSPRALRSRLEGTTRRRAGRDVSSSRVCGRQACRTSHGPPSDPRDNPCRRQGHVVVAASRSKSRAGRRLGFRLLLPTQERPGSRSRVAGCLDLVRSRRVVDLESCARI